MCLKVSWFENIYSQALITIGVPKKDCHVPKIVIHKIQIWTIFLLILDIKFKIPNEFYEL